MEEKMQHALDAALKSRSIFGSSINTPYTNQGVTGRTQLDPLNISIHTITNGYLVVIGFETTYVENLSDAINPIVAAFGKRAMER